jgi:hypothetical protein
MSLKLPYRALDILGQNDGVTLIAAKLRFRADDFN